MDDKIRKRLEDREERFSLKRDQLRLQANIDLDRAPKIGDRVKIISSRLKKAKEGEEGYVFWKGISDFNHRAVIGVKITEERKVYVEPHVIKTLEPQKY
jgi:PDZ domain-containing secreted protein